MASNTHEIDELSQIVIGCGIAVHKAFGPGLLECVYRDCLYIELRFENLQVEKERRVTLSYRDQPIPANLTVDLLIEGRLIVEVKAVERLHPVHQAQLITYLKITGCAAGLLMNFNATTLRAGLKRVDHPDVYATRDHPWSKPRHAVRD
jgi:GxxExxY protein